MTEVAAAPTAPSTASAPSAAPDNSSASAQPAQNSTAPVASTETSAPPTNQAVETSKPAEAAKPADAPADGSKPTIGVDTSTAKSAISQTDAPETKPAEDATKTNDATTAETVTFGDWTLPEGITTENLNKEGVDAYNKSLGDLAAKLALPDTDRTASLKEFGQQVFDQYMTGLRDTVVSVNEAWNNWFNERNEGWAGEFKNDEKYGRNRQQTTIKGAQDFLVSHLGKERADKFIGMLNETGAGNRVEMISALYDLNEKFKEGRVVAAQKPTMDAKNSKPWQKAYGGSK